MPSLRAAHDQQPDDAPTDPTFEALHVRNYDVADAHTVTVDVRGRDTDAAFRRRYYLGPGQGESETGVLPAGRYDVVVYADGVHRATRRVDLGPTAAETALVELGNGATSVSQGTY